MAPGVVLSPLRGFFASYSLSHDLRRGLESFAPFGAVFDPVGGWQTGYPRRPQGADATSPKTALTIGAIASCGGREWVWP